MQAIAYARSAQLQQADSPSGGLDPRLKPAAHAFEASLMQELLKPMEKDPLFSDSSASGGGLDGGGADAGMDTMSSLSTQALARALSDHGGLGLATEVLQQVQEEKMRETHTAESAQEKAAAAETALPWPGKKQKLNSSGALRHLP
ncbi:putative flagellar protein [Acidobacterium capsulatum ATCC 51196]|uniref:Putative flagellar protein n=2 Tax=Acidobacteriaceae TaxID=204434 RepID=C1F9A5_ACIC5|nr:putative flagellar protein [Acidobacterium capsulatum ATCC 51196]